MLTVVPENYVSESTRTGESISSAGLASGTHHGDNAQPVADPDVCVVDAT